MFSCDNNYPTNLDFLNDLSCKKLRELSIDNNKFVKDDLTPFDLTHLADLSI